MKSDAIRDGVLTEADTCRECVTPHLREAVWGLAPNAIGEQRSLCNGRIIVAGVMRLWGEIEALVTEVQA